MSAPPPQASLQSHGPLQVAAGTQPHPPQLLQYHQLLGSFPPQLVPQQLESHVQWALAHMAQGLRANTPYSAPLAMHMPPAPPPGPVNPVDADQARQHAELRTLFLHCLAAAAPVAETATAPSSLALQHALIQGGFPQGGTSHGGQPHGSQPFPPPHSPHGDDSTHRLQGFQPRYDQPGGNQQYAQQGVNQESSLGGVHPHLHGTGQRYIVPAQRLSAQLSYQGAAEYDIQSADGAAGRSLRAPTSEVLSELLAVTSRLPLPSHLQHLRRQAPPLQVLSNSEPGVASCTIA